MVGIMKKSSQWWWFDNQKEGNKGSPWLNSTLSELEEKTTAMLNLIEQDADSFAQRAEMYYQKRPELINMVGDFYRSYLLLAERHDQMKSDPTTRLVTSLGSPFFCEKPCPEKAMSIGEKSFDSCSDITELDHNKSSESEVDDPDEEEQGYVVEEEKQELKKLREEIEKLKATHEEQLLQKNAEIQQMKKKLESAHKEILEQKDEEKRDVIRQLTYAMAVLKEENLTLKQHFPLAEEPHKNKKSDKFFEKVPKFGFLKKLFNGSLLSSKASLVAI